MLKEIQNSFISFKRRLILRAKQLLMDSLLFNIVASQAAQALYLWVRASEVIWSEYTRIISVLSNAK